MVFMRLCCLGGVGALAVRPMRLILFSTGTALGVYGEHLRDHTQEKPNPCLFTFLAIKILSLREILIVLFYVQPTAIHRTLVYSVIVPSY